MSRTSARFASAPFAPGGRRRSEASLPSARFALRVGVRLVLVLAVALLGAPPCAHAEPPLADRALAAFGASDWRTALPLFERLVIEQPADGLARLRLGVVRLQVGDGSGGLAEIERSRALGAPLAQVEFRAACAHALLGDHEAAFAALDRALTAGFFNQALLQSEPLLASLRGTPELAALLERIDRGLRPCKYDPRYREFDYWVGTWDVLPNGAPPGTPVSENVVTLEYDGCVVHEHWKGTSGVAGESFNLYDASRGAWFQTWVDSTGGMHEYRGGLDAQGNMAFTAELAASPGQATNERGRVPTRLTFFKLGPDQVRQFSEQSTDGGKSWQTSYDLIYTRRK